MPNLLSLLILIKKGKIDEALDSAVKKYGKDLETKVRAYTPVDTGLLKSQWVHSFHKTNEVRMLTFNNNTEYAGYVEHRDFYLFKHKRLVGSQMFERAFNKLNETKRFDKVLVKQLKRVMK